MISEMKRSGQGQWKDMLSEMKRSGQGQNITVTVGQSLKEVLYFVIWNKKENTET